MFNLNIKYSVSNLLLHQTNNLSVGIKDYGLGLQFDEDISLGIKQSFDTEVNVGIKDPVISPPINPLAVHVGQGIVFFQWKEVEYEKEKIKNYELWVSESENGTYFLVTNIFTGERGVINNVPIGDSFYFKMRAIHIQGTESDYIQVKKGKISLDPIVMKVRSIEGSSIPKGAIFSSIDESTGQLISVSSINEVNLLQQTDIEVYSGNLNVLSKANNLEVVN